MELPAADDRDQVVVWRGLAWSHYEALLRARGDRAQPRLAFLDGVLEIMTTSLGHEVDKKLLARLVEAYADATDLDLNGAGQTTFRKRARRAGLEPDECYYRGRVHRVPELAIEIVKTSGGIDKLEIYRRLGVPEVWLWIAGKLAVYRLAGSRYARLDHSVALPGIDVAELATLVCDDNHHRQTQVVRAYRKRIERRQS